MTYWKSSQDRLDAPEIDSRLKVFAKEVAMSWPFQKWEVQINRDGGYRTPERQREIFKTGASKTLDSKHMRGEALDFTLYWAGTETAIWDRYSYAVVAGYMYTIAHELGLSLRWGADWNQNFKIKEEDNWEIDFVHWEIN